LDTVNWKTYNQYLIVVGLRQIIIDATSFEDAEIRARQFIPTTLLSILPVHIAKLVTSGKRI